MNSYNNYNEPNSFNNISEILNENDFGGWTDIETVEDVQKLQKPNSRRTRKGKLNRLDLDFSLNWRDERKQFLDVYLLQPQFATEPPTEDELETMANYLLWGKDRQSGLNAKQEGIELETANATWSKDAAKQSKMVSMDYLMESLPNAEQQMHPLGENHFKTKREIFSREEALSSCPADLREAFTSLFRDIDRLDLSIARWELRHNKRTKEIRPALLAKFSDAEIAEIDERISHWNQYKYLKKRHELVELRREQYFLRDSYRRIPQYQPTASFGWTDTTDWETGISVLPLGLAGCADYASQSLFHPFQLLAPEAFTENELAQISRFYWKKKDWQPSGTEKWLDFRNQEHVYQLLLAFSELDADCADPQEDSNLPKLLQTLRFYIGQADLTDTQRELLDLKLKRETNENIRLLVNAKYGKTYTTNYISTIFTQRIIPRICDAAIYHEKLVSELFFEENFKMCTGCLETLLRSEDNFTKKKRSSDGFSSRCKRCEKKARNNEEIQVSVFAIQLDDIINEKKASV